MIERNGADGAGGGEVSEIGVVSEGAAAPGTAQYLTFVLGEEEYAVDILRVQEIRGWTPVTRVPKAPAFVKGVLNLRGVIVPVVDLRERFDLPTIEYTPTTVVIVLSVHDRDRTRIVGMVVDGVSDVMDVAPEAIRAAPDFGGAVQRDFITGLAELGERMVILLDSDRLLTGDELADMSTAAED